MEYNDGIKFTAYSDKGEKYITMFKVENNRTIWSRHYEVKAAADDRGIKGNGFDESEAFPQLQHC